MRALLAYLLSLFRRPSPPPPPEPVDEFTFVQDGQTFVLDKRTGDVYIITDAQREFVTHLYDPNFYEKNYVEVAGQRYQIDPESGTRYPVTREFRDIFAEGPLLAADRWHSDNTLDTYRAEGNTISLSDDGVRFQAFPSAQRATKASLAKGIMFFRKGDTVEVSGSFYLDPTPSVYDVGGFTLIDLESTFMQNIGLRVIVRKGDALAFELELPKTSYSQDTPVAFPTGQWVHITTQVYLSDTDGWVKIWQDGVLVLDTSGRTLPIAECVYDRFEIGVTATGKGSRYEKVLYIDEINISAEETL